MKLLLLSLILLTSCVEYRLSRSGFEDKYIGLGTNTKPALDPKVGPKTKAFLNSGGTIRPYIGGEIIHKEELLLGLGVIYYVSQQVSLEIGYRDSVFKNDKLLEQYQDHAQNIDPWDDVNPIFYIGGVVRF